MPAYVVTTEMGRLDQVQKDEIARGITVLHGDANGGQEPLVTVLFLFYGKGNAWSSASPAAPTIVQGSLRAGRSQRVRTELMLRISDLVCEVMSIPACDVRVEIAEHAPHLAVEAGMLTPVRELKAERAWAAELGRRFPPEVYGPL